MNEVLDLLIYGKQILTLKGGIRKGSSLAHLGIIEDGIVGIKNGKINLVEERSGKKFDAKYEIDASNELVMPGFIDSHTHLLFYGSREEEFELRIKGYSYNEIQNKGGGIWNTVKKTINAKDDELEKILIERIRFAIENGTTTIEIKSGYGIEPEQEIRLLKLLNRIKYKVDITIIPTFLAHLPPKNRSEYVEKITNEILPYIRINNLAKFVDVFCEESAFNKMETLYILKKARDEGFSLKIHAGEFKDIGCCDILDMLDLTSIDHLVYSNEQCEEKIINKSVCVTLLPATSFSLMQRPANARKYIEKDIIISLASDFSPASWILSLQEVISIACRYLKLLPSECISATTINAAYALKMDKDYGSIEKGKFADVLVMNVPNYNWIGYTMGFNHVKFTIKEGKIVYAKE